jgi:hypothetical protein
MGRLLKDSDRNFVSKCGECGIDSRQKNGYFIYNLKDVLAESEELQKAYKWFFNRDFDVPPADVIDKRGSFTDEELGYIFVLEDLIDRLLAGKSECLACFKGK